MLKTLLTLIPNINPDPNNNPKLILFARFTVKYWQPGQNVRLWGEGKGNRAGKMSTSHCTYRSRGSTSRLTSCGAVLSVGKKGQAPSDEFVVA